jgi:hypothetical protein
MRLAPRGIGLRTSVDTTNSEFLIALTPYDGRQSPGVGAMNERAYNV